MTSAQEFFDKTVNAIRSQGRPSMKGGVCCYRGEGGLKCAAGHHISDEEYSPNMEGLACRSEYFQVLLPEGHALKEHKELARALQRAHDDASASASFLDTFEGLVIRISMRYFLLYTPPGAGRTV